MIKHIKRLLGLNKPKPPVYQDPEPCPPDCIACNGTRVGKSTYIDLRSRKARIYDYLDRMGPSGATVEEISDDLGITENTVRPRINELEKLGAVTFYQSFDGETASGRPARIYITAEHYARSAFI